MDPIQDFDPLITRSGSCITLPPYLCLCLHTRKTNLTIDQQYQKAGRATHLALFLPESLGLSSIQNLDPATTRSFFCIILHTYLPLQTRKTNFTTEKQCWSRTTGLRHLLGFILFHSSYVFAHLELWSRNILRAWFQQSQRRFDTFRWWPASFLYYSPFCFGTCFRCAFRGAGSWCCF